MRPIFNLIPLFAACLSLSAALADCGQCCSPAAASSHTCASRLIVRTDYREACDFESLQEFFWGQEDARGRLILRSEPCSRCGMYFLINLPKCAQALPGGTRVKIDYHRSDEPKSRTHIFTLDTATCPQEHASLLLGLTGNDWPCEAVKLNAWKVQILDNTGSVLEEAWSFAWDNSDAFQSTSII